MKSKLVLWKWGQAESINGHKVNSIYGNQLKNAEDGQVFYICATKKDELYLLGKLLVLRITSLDSEYSANVKSLSGNFAIIPMLANKWKLRFESKTDRLSKVYSLGQQLQAHRLLTTESTLILEDILKTSSQIQSDEKELSEFKKEGAKMETSLSLRERDPKVRSAALKHYGYSCTVCDLEFKSVYGGYQNCVEVHHLKPLANRKKGEKTRIEDVVVLCPNCHRAIHKYDDPSDWEGLRSIVVGEKKKVVAKVRSKKTK